ncbi:hypothetical protein [Streptomyces sp. NPDC051219]|uniref:hypothetical protein n=1 Tax=Streptomyces sp. NPDC051219 TaxID=3155283 RepID=UPI003442E4F5
MTLTITVTCPRLTMTPPTRQFLHTATRLAAPAAMAAAEVAGVGLLGRVLLSTVLTATEDAVRP